MGKSQGSGRELVIERANNICEKCGVVLTKNVHGVPDGITARSIHHRQPRRQGGKDSVWCLTVLCLGCHREIHEDEEAAALDGWITDRHPARVPFRGWKGWVLPRADGGLDLLDFGGSGRLVPLEDPPPARKRKRGHRPRRTMRQTPQVA